jgi:hypothetical protein
MYKKYSFVVNHKKEVTMYMQYSCDISLHRAVLHVHCHLFFMFHYTQLYFMYIVTSFLYFTTNLYFMHIVVHEVQLFVERNMKKEVTMYMKYSSV